MTGKNTVLLIGSNKMNSFVVKQALSDSFNMLEIKEYGEAMSKINGLFSRLAVVICCGEKLTDEMDGFISSFIKSGYAVSVPVIVMMPNEEFELSSRKCYELGASEIVELPFDPYYLKSKIQALQKLYTGAVLNDSDDGNGLSQRTDVIINILSSVFEFIQFEPSTHITRVKGLTNIIAVTFADLFPEYGLEDDDIKYISQASAMHDIGKAAIPTNILFKAGKLTGEEFAIMKTHTVKCEEILLNFGLDHSHKFFSYAFDICKYHHERWDGNGYPDRLEGEQIPVAAQIVSIVDVYDALISERVYKAAIPYDKSLSMIREGQCGMFPPKVIKAFNTSEKSFRSYLEDALHVKIRYDDGQDEDK